MQNKISQWILFYWLTWLLNCGLAPAPGHTPAGPPWRGLLVLEGVTECGAPFWRDIWASICPAEWAGCAICGVMLTGLQTKVKGVRALLPGCHLLGENKTLKNGSPLTNMLETFEINLKTTSNQFSSMSACISKRGTVNMKVYWNIQYSLSGLHSEGTIIFVTQHLYPLKAHVGSRSTSIPFMWTKVCGRDKQSFPIGLFVLTTALSICGCSYSLQ